MRKVYMQELDTIYTHLVNQANAVSEAIFKAMKSFNENDLVLAQEIIDNDLNINKMLVDIEREAYRLISLQQPVADDLRLIFTVLQASNDLERIADHASSIARAIIRSQDEYKDDEINELVREMGLVAEKMITGVTKAIVDRSMEEARLVAQMDDEMDELRHTVFRKSASRMVKDTGVIKGGLSLLTSANHLERIGDYITNICERLVFMDTGAIVELN